MILLIDVPKVFAESLMGTMAMCNVLAGIPVEKLRRAVTEDRVFVHMLEPEDEKEMLEREGHPK